MENLIPPQRFPFPPDGPCAPSCDDQLPIISRVGRGLKGDDITAKLVTDEDGHIHLEIYQHDNTDNSWTKIYDAIVDGGRLKYYYNLEPFNDPATFTITWLYDNADPDKSWQWTTPAIPYLWTAEQAGTLQPDDVVGSGVGSLFIKKTYDEWQDPIETPHTEEDTHAMQEKLIYPTGWVRDNFNAPDPTEPWTVNLTYGIGGDIDAPNLEDISKIIGVSPTFIEDLIENTEIPYEEGFDYDPVTGEPYSVKDYIDNLDEHIHEDMGFGDILVNDGDADTQTPKRNTIKKWLDWIISRLGFGDLINPGNNITVKQYIDNGNADLKTYIDNALGDILDKIVCDDPEHHPHQMDSDGHIWWGAPADEVTAQIPVGNLDLYGADNRSQWIKTHGGEPAENDVWAR